MDGLQLARLHSHYEETVYFLPLGSKGFLVLKGLKAELTLQPPSSFEIGTPGLEIQYLNP